MSRRPQSTRSRPGGSTSAKGTSSRASKLARCKRHSLSPFPNKTTDQRKSGSLAGWTP